MRNNNGVHRCDNCGGATYRFSCCSAECETALKFETLAEDEKTNEVKR